MDTAHLPTFLAAMISWDPITLVSQMGIVARLILLSLFAMACWICWSALAKRDAERVRSRVRYMRAIGQTAPRVGFLGTAIRPINGLTSVARQASPNWHA